MNTNLLLNIQWQESSLYDAGTRQILIPWTSYAIPQTGNQFSLSADYFDHFYPHECFSFEGQNYNLYQWIEHTYGWRIMDIKWVKHHGKQIASLVLADDV